MKKLASLVLIAFFALASLGIPRVAIPALLHLNLNNSPEAIGSLAGCALIIAGLVYSIRWNRKLRKGS